MSSHSSTSIPNNFCCSHPRLTSPVPLPPRPIFLTSNIEDHLFAAAALPEDHPHAFKFPDRRIRPSSVTMNIVKSPPGLRERMIDRLRRASLMSFRTSSEQLQRDAKVLSDDDVENCEDPVAERESSELEEANVAEIAEAVATRWPVSKLEDTGKHSPISKAVSSPDLLNRIWGRPLAVRKSRSAFLLNGTPGSQAINTEESTRSGPNDVEQAIDFSSNLQLEKETDCDDPDYGDMEIDKARLSGRSNNIHLQSMDISQQLRSVSQPSDITEDDGPAAPQPWTFHRRITSHAAASIASVISAGRWPNNDLSDHTIVAPSIENGRSAEDTSSSIYSRSCSPAMSSDQIRKGIRPIDVAIIPLSDDWPLKDDKCIDMDPESTYEVATSTSPPSSVIKETPCTIHQEIQSTPKSGVMDRMRSFPRLSCSEKSVPSKGSSNTLNSKTSRFLERFSPPKKTVTKRRSIFKFLRPHSFRQSKSLDRPFLRHASCPGALDGTSGDDALLTVEYELVEYPSKDRSFNSARPEQVEPESAKHLAVAIASGDVDHRLSLADYERGLTAGSDDRRRPSTVNVQAFLDIQDEERRESLSVRRGIKRAAALYDQDSSPLMAQALRKHQAEKSMFWSESKRRESMGTRSSPIFRPPAFATPGGSLPPPSVPEHNELLDPLDKSSIKYQSSSSNNLPIPDSIHVTGKAVQPPLSSSSSLDVEIDESPKAPRIGTSLRSWSKFPSHTRSDRCGSAGLSDTMRTWDFADNSSGHQQGSGQVDPSESNESSKAEGKRRRRSFIRSRSMNFSTILRYYQNLFTSSGFKGQNRRTSVSFGGKLRNPDLEMLPPSTATSTEHHHFKHIHEHLKKVEQHMADDIEDFFHQKPRRRNKASASVSHSSFQHPTPPKSHEQTNLHNRQDSFIAPEDDISTPDPQPSSSNSTTSPKTDTPIGAPTISSNPPNPNLDGTHPSHPSPSPPISSSEKQFQKPPTPSPSKATLLSAEYTKCLPTPEDIAFHHPPSVFPEAAPLLPSTTTAIPPAPPGGGSGGSSIEASLGAGVRVKRYPSVTVIDDRRGHERSVSLISSCSTKNSGLGRGSLGASGVYGKTTGKYNGNGKGNEKEKEERFERESTGDLFLLLKRREREEREKLIFGT